MFITTPTKIPFAEKNSVNPLVSGGISLLSLTSLLAFSLGSWSLNPGVMAILQNPLSNEVTLDYLNGLAFPTVGALLLTQFAHEFSHLLVSWFGKFKVSERSERALVKTRNLYEPL